jgi:hypothetical protein
MLLEHMGRHVQESGKRARAEKAFAKARELGKRASRLAELSQEHESMSGNKLDDVQDV